MKVLVPSLSRLAIVLVGSALASACGSSPSPTAQQAMDLAPAKGATFDANEIVTEAAFTDGLAFGAREIEMFLSLTPYGGPSFLATYQSGGVLAEDAIATAAANYGINPLFFLVRAEVAGGLIGDPTYPPGLASQVEFVFGCGCTSPSTCDPSFAGLDKQVDCLGSALRTSLDQIAATGHTAGGWGPGIAAKTLDGVSVTPADASTAALYQYDPIVGQGKSDNWLVWNVWQHYANAVMYMAPPDPVAGATAQIGDACFAASECAFASPICATGKGYPGGLCTSKCSGSCPGMDAFCANFTSSGFCLAVCNPTDPASCRANYSCTLVSQFGGPSPTKSANVCTPL
jgi:hypothetical protein